MSRRTQFEQILRPLFEARAVVGWAIASIWCLGWAIGLRFATGTILILAAMCVTLCLWRASGAYRLATMKLSLIGKPVRTLLASPSDDLALGDAWEELDDARQLEPRTLLCRRKDGSTFTAMVRGSEIGRAHV